MFAIEPFPISIKSCNEKNAYSNINTAEITICSELMMHLLMSGNKNAIHAIFAHELGHSLLNKIGMPNWNNEQTADEFSIVMLFWNGTQQHALDLIRFHEEKDSAQQALNAMQNYAPHPLSIQRIRNIKRILDSPTDTINRWNALLYPYLTNEKLKEIASNPGHYHNDSLAISTLKSRD